jgi:hypothetical protein
MGESRRKSLFTVLLVSLLLAAVEVGARLILSYPPVFRRVARQSDAAWRLEWAKRHAAPVPSRYSFDLYHPTRGWTLKPGLNHNPMARGKTLTTNSKGLRSAAEVSYGRRSQGERIALNRGETYLRSVCLAAGVRFHSLRQGLAAAVEPGDRGAMLGHWPARIHLRAAALIRDTLEAEKLRKERR